MNREKIIAAIIDHENRFDLHLESAASHLPLADNPHNRSSYETALVYAARSASILAELRHRLAIIEGKS